MPVDSLSPGMGPTDADGSPGAPESVAPALPARDESSRAVLCTAERLAHKWHPVIIHILLDGPRGFSNLEAAIHDVSSKVLTESLHDLEEHGLVDRNVISTAPLRVEYRLTSAGTDLGEVVQAMQAWGTRYLGSP